MLPSVKIILKTTPVLLNYLKQMILYWLNHTDRYGLHLNHDGTRILAKNLRPCAEKYWHDKNSVKETFTHLNTVKNCTKLITNDLNHESNIIAHLVEEYDLALNVSQIDDN